LAMSRDRVDEAEEVLAVGEEAREGTQGLRAEGSEETFRQEACATEEGGEGCPELVGDVGDELLLVLAGYLELAALASDLLEQARVLQGNGRLVGEALHETDN